MPPRKKSKGSAATERGGFWKRPRWRTVGGAALIAGLVFIAYSRALNGGFVWDDEPLTTGSDLIKSPDALRRIWLTTDPIDYWPVTNSVFWLEWRLFGNHPLGYHVTNVVLHIGSSLLIWAILRRLAIPGAFLAGLLFAVHPVNVESVAWIAQLKNTLSMFFFLVSALCYLGIETPAAPRDRLYAAGTGRWYWLSLATYALAVLSKGSVIVLPALLLLIVWWRRGVSRWDLVRLSPFFLIGAVSAVVNVWFQKHGAEVTVRTASGLERLLGAGGVIWFYLWKALLPIKLNFVYPQWTVRAEDIRWWLPLGAAIAVTAVLWWRRRTRVGGALLLAWGFFCVALVPVMGFVDVIFMQYSLVADHYQYVAIISVIALAAACWSIWRERVSGVMQAVVVGAAVVVVGMFTAISFTQAADYRDAVTLYRAILERNPECWMAYNNLGIEMDNRGRVPEAIGYYQKALELNPYDGEAENNLGSAMLKVQRARDAIAHFERAIQLNPQFAPAYFNLGNAHGQLGETEEAVKQYQRARELAPNLSTAHFNLAQGFGSLGKWPEAIDEYQKALSLNPQLAEAENNLGGALMRLGKSEQAIPHLMRAISIDPNYASAHNNLAIALISAGRADQAIAQFQEATRLQPDYLEAYMNLALSLAQLNRSAEAVAAARSGLEVARAQGNRAKAQQIEAWLNSYQAAPSNPSAGPAEPGTLPLKAPR